MASFARGNYRKDPVRRSVAKNGVLGAIFPNFREISGIKVASGRKGGVPRIGF